MGATTEVRMNRYKLSQNEQTTEKSNGIEVGKPNDASCHVDEQFVHVQVENVKISAKRAHTCTKHRSQNG